MSTAKQIIAEIIKKELQYVSDSAANRVSDRICKELSLDKVSVIDISKSKTGYINPFEIKETLTKDEIISGAAFISTLEDKSVEASLEDILNTNGISFSKEEKNEIIKDTYKLLNDAYKNIK